MITWFEFAGHNSREFGIRLEAAAYIQRPEERVENVTIPGRSGDVTLTEGDGVYNAYMQNVNIRVPSGQLPAVKRWLRGDGYVTFSNDQDRRQKARIVKAITYEKASPLLEWYTGEVVFYVQPMKERKNGDDAITVADGDTIYNTGDVAARPIIEVEADNIDFSVTINETTIFVNASTRETLDAGNVWRIDCDAEELLRVAEDGSTELYTNLTSGSFPVLEVGENTVELSGITEAMVIPNFRFV